MKDPIKWGAYGAIGCATIDAFMRITGMEMSPTMEAMPFMGVVCAGFGWGFIVALIVNRTVRN